MSTVQQDIEFGRSLVYGLRNPITTDRDQVPSEQDRYAYYMGALSRINTDPDFIPVRAQVGMAVKIRVAKARGPKFMARARKSVQKYLRMVEYNLPSTRKQA